MFLKYLKHHVQSIIVMRTSHKNSQALRFFWVESPQIYFSFLTMKFKDGNFYFFLKVVKQQKSCIVIFLLIWLRVGTEGKYGLIFPHSTVILVFNSKTNEKYYNLFNVNIEKWLGIWKNNLKNGALNLRIFFIWGII